MLGAGEGEDIHPLASLTTKLFFSITVVVIIRPMELEKKTEKRQKQQILQSMKNLHQLKNNENKSASELFDSISNRIRKLKGKKCLKRNQEKRQDGLSVFAN